MARGLEQDPIVAAIEQAMVRVRRTINRGWFAREVHQALGADLDLAVVGVLDALEEAAAAGEGAITVGGLGSRLGVDQSRASRMAATAIRSGHVRRLASAADGRRVGLQMTEAGRSLLAEVHRLRRRVAARLVADWPAEDRAAFARLFTAFVGAAERQGRPGVAEPRDEGGKG